MKSFQDIAKRRIKVKKVTGSDISSEKMATESKSGRSSPDPNCSICLSKMKDKSFTDRCFHMFCFECLVEWSKINAVCPLCKQPFKQIFHNIRSMSDYDVYDVLSHSSVLPPPSSLQTPALSVNVTQPLLTNCHDVRVFLTRSSTQIAFREWLEGHIKEYTRVDVIQSSFIADLVLNIIRVWHISSQNFYESISQFFGHQTLNFIHSLDQHIYHFMRPDSVEHSLDSALQRMRSRSAQREALENNMLSNIGVPTVMASHRTLRSSTTSRHFIDGVLQSNTSNSSNPGPSKFSLLLSIIRPSRARNIHGGSSSSSSSPREDELIDIEQLDENPTNSQISKSPICVSSGEENHVQPIQCSSRTKSRHMRKRKQHTFLLVSSDDETTTAPEGRKRLKTSSSTPKAVKNVLQTKSSDGEVKVTFKKHHTGHKNSLKKRASAVIVSEEQNEEKISNHELKAEGESTRNPVVPGSSSSQDVRDQSGTDIASPTQGALSKKDFPNDSSKQTNDDSKLDKSCILLGTELLDIQREEVTNGSDLIDVDTISVYSDDSIEWIEDIPVELLSLRRKRKRVEDDVEVVDFNASDVILVSPVVSAEARERAKRNSDARHVFVDLSDEESKDEPASHKGRKKHLLFGSIPFQSLTSEGSSSGRIGCLPSPSITTPPYASLQTGEHHDEVKSCQDGEAADANKRCQSNQDETLEINF